MRKLTQEQVILDFKQTHGDLYEYSDVVFINTRKKVKIGCKIHGIFEQHVNNHKNGEGCPLCGKLKGRSSKSQEDYINEVSKIHNYFYEYGKTIYKSAHDKIIITCKKHGDFEQSANEHRKGKGCEKCSYEKRGYGKRLGEDKLFTSLKSIHDNKYYIDREQLNDYKNTQKEYIDIYCKKHGMFTQKISNHLYGQGCPKCAVSISKAEDEINEFLNMFIETKQRYKLLNKKEIDIFIPKLNIGIEYNGLRWHSDLFQKDNLYHLNKTNYCKEHDIKLIHIFEDEWLFKKEIVKSRLLNLIEKTPNKIYARKCEVHEVSSKDSIKFLEENHIQGSLLNSINLGLFYNNELVSLMTFGHLRRNMGSKKKDGVFELTRFCNKINTNVIGGASKLLKHFEKNYKPFEIVSYADRRWSKGNLYEQLGFEFVHNSRPNYFYFKKLIRENRFKYRKSELVKQGFDPNKTEKQIMEERGYNRIYDCGTMKFIKIY